MHRWLVVSGAVIVTALGVLVPAGAQASTVAATKLTSGKPVKATISKPGQQLKYTFAATANKNVTFDVTRFNFSDGGQNGEVFLEFHEPGSSSVYTQCDVDANTYCNFTPPVAGTWSLVLVPYENSVGSLTLTFANDVPTQALTSGTAVTTAIKFAGQQAGYTFVAKANQNVTFDVTRFNFSDDGQNGEVFLEFHEPGNSSVYTQCDVDTNTTCPVKTPVGGTWSIALIPYEASVGSLTIKLA